MFNDFSLRFCFYLYKIARLVELGLNCLFRRHCVPNLKYGVCLSTKRGIDTGHFSSSVFLIKHLLGTRCHCARGQPAPLS